MELDRLGKDAEPLLRDVLGRLNFSSGAPDPRLARHLDELYRRATVLPDAPGAPWLPLHRELKAKLALLAKQDNAFAESEQVAAVLEIVFERLPPAYRQHHRDLLFHQPDHALFNSFFLARACEAVLLQGGPWDEPERILTGALEELNDFIGHRPVAVLQSTQKIQPYAHEWVRPIPLFIRGAGTAFGRYAELIDRTLAVLEQTEPALREQAHFDLELLDELALDPRAYDFDHPVNKRTNYLFGQWDPHQIDGKGRFRRFVLQQVTVDALLGRIEQSEQLPREEALFEAAAVLAGTMLMAAGISGGGPDTHDSSVTLASLLPQMAKYRDAFYKRLLDNLAGPHGERLRAEAKALKQPFAGARQHLNQRLARLRAKQLQHVHLAHLFARMGNPQASAKQARILPVASTRMVCDIVCRLTAGHFAIDQADLVSAARCLPEIEDLLHRAIGCGALVDPWNILGFGGQFSLFPAVENSVRDHRVDQLIRLMQRIFGLYARLRGEAAAKGQTELEQQAARGLMALAKWWDKFATLDVAQVQSVSGRESYESAELVAGALGAWHKAGAAAGNIAFWRQHVQEFNSPKAFALVIDALLEQKDQVASMALMMQWISQVEQSPLEDGDYSFGALAARWLQQLRRAALAEAAGGTTASWKLLERYFDYLEANADEYWQVPRFEFAPPEQTKNKNGPAEEPPDDDEEAGDLFGAAYEEMTFRDSTADGVEGEMLEGGQTANDFELDQEQARLNKRLSFLMVLAELWKHAAVFPGNDPARAETLSRWLQQAESNAARLKELLQSLHRYRLPAPRGTRQSLVEYDRRRSLLEGLLESVCAACLAAGDAARYIRAALPPDANRRGGASWETLAVDMQRAMFVGQTETVRKLFPQLLERLRPLALLYIPFVRRGDPETILAARSLRQVVYDLLRGLPRIGLLRETCQLIQTVQTMEREHLVGAGAVTQFDRLFSIGYQSLVESLVDSADHWERQAGDAPAGKTDAELIECVQLLTESLIMRWLNHSRSLRLSVLEKVGSEQAWQALAKFVQTYGEELFTQMFLNLGNLQAILHQGVDQYLTNLAEEPDERRDSKLLEALDKAIPRAEAVAHLEIILEAIADNYAEYLDYNTTTTQSDHGGMLHTLLDFLRLKCGYERIAWNLRPAVIAHEILVRRGRNAAAEVWRRALAERMGDAAEDQVRKLAELSKKHGFRLSTVADRLSERFVQPLQIDRLKALVKPAMQELRNGPSTAFDLFEQEIEEFSQTPVGVGIDVPAWLTDLEQEVNQVQLSGPADEPDPALPPHFPLPLDEIQQQLNSWEDAGK